MNLLYINTHDTGRLIKPYGFDIPTPALADLASDSTLFTHAFCCGPTCSPSRASMLTGTYPHQNGMLGLAQRGFSLKDSSMHLANYLRMNQYRTCISGIQHETGWYLNINNESLHDLGYDEILTVPSEKYEKEELHLWDAENADRVVDWINRYDNTKPFMISYGLHSTHRPYPVEIASDIDERYVRPASPIPNNKNNRHDHAQYMTSAANADLCISKVIGALKAKGIYDETLIIYTTDHGVAVPFNKCNLTDAGIGVGLIVRNPNTTTKGVVAEQLISQIDIFPTICDLLKIKKPSYLEGKSFSEIMEKGSDEEINDFVFAEVNFHTSYEPTRCIRNRRYKYIRYYDNSWNKYNLSNMDESIPKSFFLLNGLENKKKYKEGLFDCLYNPEESNNIINDEDIQGVLEELRLKMNEIQKRTEDPVLNGELEIKPTYKVNKTSCLNASSTDPNDYL